MADTINTMPYNRDAEMALLGCLLIDHEIAAELVEKLNEEDFYQEPNAKIMFRINEKDMPALEERIKLFENPNYKGNKTQPNLMEFQHQLEVL